MGSGRGSRCRADLGDRPAGRHTGTRPRRGDTMAAARPRKPAAQAAAGPPAHPSGRAGSGGTEQRRTGAATRRGRGPDADGLRVAARVGQWGRWGIGLAAAAILGGQSGGGRIWRSRGEGAGKLVKG